MWRTRTAPSSLFQDGAKVRAYGRVTVWEQAGKYQLDVQNLLPVGIGSMQAAFELLKNRLSAEGIFDSSRKRQLPKYPNRIGIVTSPTGAVIHDLAWGLTTRFPPAKIFLIPVAVQGDGAAAQIAGAIDRYNHEKMVDVIVIGRGGGSLEDLWAFNEEIVVRAIVRSKIPVVSAVGHEVDFTLSDLAADVRAPTPTGAAALVVPDRKDLLQTIHNRRESLTTQLERRVILWRERIARITQGYGFKKLPGRINDERLRLDEISRRLDSAFTRGQIVRTTAVATKREQLQALSPQAVLGRGYSVIRKQDGTMVRDSSTLQLGETLDLSFFVGQATASIDSIKV